MDWVDAESIAAQLHEVWLALTDVTEKLSQGEGLQRCKSEDLWRSCLFFERIPLVIALLSLSMDRVLALETNINESVEKAIKKSA